MTKQGEMQRRERNMYRQATVKLTFSLCDGDLVGLASGLLGIRQYVRGATGVKVPELDAVISGIYGVLVCSSATWYHSCAILSVFWYAG